MLKIVGTPIGNLSDLSLRQAQTIYAADIILAENTGSAGILLSQIVEYFPDLERNPKQRVMAFHKDNEFEKIAEVFSLLEDGSDVALISESGMPIVSDPGHLLVQQLVKKEIGFEVIPGPTAWTTALVYSGFDIVNSTFLGFLPKKPQDKKRLFEDFRSDSVYVAYESPFRVQETLEILSQVQPKADIVICRELTKKFEEIVRGKAVELLKREYKGEIAIVVHTTAS